MTSILALVRAASLFAAAAFAGHAAAQPVADPAAPVPATNYKPALPASAPAVPAARPDQHWKAANRTVAATNSMMLTMSHRHEPAPAPAPDPHAHHRQAAPAPAHEHDHGAVK